MSDKKFKTIFFITLLLGIAIIFFLWLNTPKIVAKWSQEPNSDFAKFGAFGDQFGTITSLFTSLGFLLLGAALFYQIREFSLQRKEYFENRKSLNKQNNLTERNIYAQEDANKLARLRMRFEFIVEALKLASNTRIKSEKREELKEIEQRIIREYTQDPDYLAKYKK